jgi:hypothetical protein
VKEKGEEWDYSTVLFDELLVEVFAYALDADMAVICKELTAFANRLIPYFLCLSVEFCGYE